MEKTIKTVDFFGIIISENDAQGMYEWMRDPRSKPFWDLLRLELDASNDKAVTMTIDKSLHPTYADMIRNNEIGRVNAFREVLSYEGNVKEMLSNLKK